MKLVTTPMPTPDDPTVQAALREQLSCWMDGELDADQARFLLRRLEHDGALADTWSRWQACGAMLRGHATGLVRPNFAADVIAAVRAEEEAASAAPAAVRRAPARGWWLGGGALAASVAVAAVLLGQRLSPIDAAAPLPATAVVAATPASPSVAATRNSVASAPVRAVPRDGAAKPAAARVASVRTVRPARAAVTPTPAAKAEQPAAMAVAAAATTAPVATVANPFAAPTPAAKPWPKPAIAGLDSAEYTASFHTDARWSARAAPFPVKQSREAATSDSP